MDNNKKTGAHLENYIRWFSELSKEDFGAVGNKAADLGEIYNANFPVPKGFAVTTDAFIYFLNNKSLREKILSIIETIDIENTEELNKRAGEIRNLIEGLEFPNDLKEEILEAYRILSSEKINPLGISANALTILKNSEEPAFVAVRNSVYNEKPEEASFAGQFESFLYIKGERILLEHVKKCFSSLYTPRAIYYRNKFKFSEENAKIGVIVMKMVDSEKSGVIFSKNPIGNTENILIESIYGSCEGIVSGKINPDHYLISKNLEIQETKISNKKIALVRSGSGQVGIVKLTPERSKSPVLTNGQIVEAANYSARLEELFNKPLNIEFGIEGNKFYVLQSRPITKIISENQKNNASNGKVLLEGNPANPGIGTGIVKIIKQASDLTNIKKGEVIVSEINNPDNIVAMKKASAIVADESGITSNGAIVSREMIIPCITGAENAANILKDGMKISIDAYNGKIYEGEIKETKHIEIKQAIKTNKVKLKLVIDLPENAKTGSETGIDSIGLLKIEGMIASSLKHPLLFEKEGKLTEYSDIIKNGIEEVSKYFDSIWIRTSDMKSDEYESLAGNPEKERNPLLGQHGIRFSLKHIKIFEAEISAIKSAAEKNPSKKFGILFPQLISVEELRIAKQTFEKFKLENMDFGVIVETPASVQIIESLCNEGVKLIVIGTDDLIQYTLAIDKEHADLQHLYHESHPSLFSQIRRVIGAARRNKIESGIYGRSVNKRDIIELLFKEGINSIYASPEDSYEISLILSLLEEKRNQAYLAKKQEEEKKQKELQQQKSRQIFQQNVNKKFDKHQGYQENFVKLQNSQETKFKDNRNMMPAPGKDSEMNEPVSYKGSIKPMTKESGQEDKAYTKEEKGEYRKIEHEEIPAEEISFKEPVESLEEELTGEAIIKDFVEDSEEESDEPEKESSEAKEPETEDSETTEEESSEAKENKSEDLEGEGGIDDIRDVLDLTKKNQYSYFDDDYR